MMSIGLCFFWFVEGFLKLFFKFMLLNPDESLNDNSKYKVKNEE
jgi:hypothetical protein